MGLSHLAVARLAAMWGRLARCVDAAAGLAVTMFGHGENRGRRAVSPVVAVVLTVAIVVVIAASVGWVGLGFSEQLREPAPNIAESTGKLEPVDGGDGGVVTITHTAGDSVEVEHVEIRVDATDACGKRARIVSLPAEVAAFPQDQFSDANIDGDEKLIAKGTLPWLGQEPWDGGALLDTTDNTLSAGDSFQFRIASGHCDLNTGDTVAVRVVHLPSESVIITQDLRPF